MSHGSTEIGSDKTDERAPLYKNRTSTWSLRPNVAYTKYICISILLDVRFPAQDWSFGVKTAISEGQT